MVFRVIILQYALKSEIPGQHLAITIWDYRSIVMCGGLVFSVPATRSARYGFESRPRDSPQSGLRGGRLLCKNCTYKNKYPQNHETRILRTALSHKVSLRLSVFFLSVSYRLSPHLALSLAHFFSSGSRLMCLVLQITLPLSFCLTDSQFLCLFLGLTLSLSYRLSVL